MNEKELYLSERKHVSKANNSRSASKINYWGELLGEGFLEKLISKNENIDSHMRGSNYSKKKGLRGLYKRLRKTLKRTTR